MLDDFFTRAIIAGVGVAIIAGPLGCFIVWRRLAYFGDTLSHSALLGIALGLLFQLNLTLSVFIVCAAISLILIGLQRYAAIGSDAILGLLSHSSLALGLVCLAFISFVRVDLTSFLFGDILSVSVNDILLIYTGGFIVLGILAYIWHPLFAATVSKEIAEAEGMSPEKMNVIFMLLMAVVIAIAMKIVGVLLITALLIIPAAAARHFASTPENMAFLAAGSGVVSVVLGLFGSLEWDTPSGPSIVVAALCIFLINLALSSTIKRLFLISGERK